MRITVQNTTNVPRSLLTLEGSEKVRITRELAEKDYSDIFTENQHKRISKLSQRLEMIRTYQKNNASSFYSTDEIEGIESELIKLKESKIDMNELSQEFLETGCRIVEYKVIPRELFVDTSVLDNIIADIWKITKQLEQSSNFTFPELPNLGQTHQLNLLCAYMVGCINLFE